MTDTKNSGLIGMLPVMCARRRKTVNVQIPVDDMKGYIQGIEARERNGKALLVSLEEIPEGQTPDLVVIYRGQAFVLPTVVDDAKQDLAVKRALNVALGADEATTFFDVPAPASRAPRTGAAAASNGASTAADGEADS